MPPSQHRRPRPRAAAAAAAIATAAVVVSLVTAGHAQDRRPQIDAYLAHWHQIGGFDGVVLVAQEDRVIYENGFGLADRRWGIANGATTRFDIGSIAKQFTTALVLLLADEGRLRLDGRLTDYLSDYRKDTGSRVTLDHLLRQTSGIPCFLRDYVAPPGGPDRFPLERTYDRRRLIADSMSGDLQFEPGSQYRYSNTNYCLLAAVIEQVTGRSFEEVLRTRLLTPLGLSDTGLLSPVRVVERLATGYVRTPLGHRRAAHEDERTLWGAGGMYSTARDLLRWNLAIHSGAWLSDAMRERWTTPYTPPGPVRHAYSLDHLALRLPKSGRVVGYTTFNGATEGYISDVVRFPDSGHVVVVLDNSDSFNHQRIAGDIYRLLHDEPVALPRQSAAPVIAAVAVKDGAEAAMRRLQELRARTADYDADNLDAGLQEQGRSLVDKGEPAAAVAVLAFNARLHPGSSRAHASLGAALQHAGQSARADEHLRLARTLDERESAIVSALEAGDFDKANAAIAAARAARPEGTLVPPARIGPIFERLLAANQLDRALALTEAWTSIAPAEVGPHFSMARVFLQMGTPDRAVACYQRVLALRPEGPSAETARREIARLRKAPNP